MHDHPQLSYSRRTERRSTIIGLTVIFLLLALALVLWSYA
jgi:predicted nucleic acid-binding Zn ribbon protein